MDRPTNKENRLSELIDNQKSIYANGAIEERLKAIIRHSPHASLTDSEIQDIFRQSTSIFFDSHVEVVSGHHTATYLRFESIAQYPKLMSRIVYDMAQWIVRLSKDHTIDGIVTPSSDAKLLAEGIAVALNDHISLRVVYAPFDHKTGKIGTEVSDKAIRQQESFVVLNDVTTRGNCVSKLGKIVTDHGGTVSGMMVFARRDSGQFPLMDELTAQYPFYYCTALNMPQWEASICPLCERGETLYSWKDMPFLSRKAPLQSNHA